VALGRTERTSGAGGAAFDNVSPSQAYHGRSLGIRVELRSDGSMLREPSVTGESSQRITPHLLGVEASVPPPPAHVPEAVVVIGD
jgi:hypothetical protein